MKISLISGSQRTKSQSTKVANYCNFLLKQVGVTESLLFDLGENPLPIWNPDMWEKESDLKSLWQEYSKGISDSDGYVLVCPEYNGMASPALKNMFLYFSNTDLAHKPGIIITVSSGLGGAYPNNELRTSSYKNSRIVYIPDHVIVRHVEAVLNQDIPESKDDERIRKRLQYSIAVFLEYVKALKSVRESGVIDLKTFAAGF
ncbi:NADPH-dependent FMN reductase [Leptospira ilyithenensis]|uniref:NADPH-dependent oxidoreductase n=1 Tax=Leptospira ilyithenensis TaxID=2484901 RepID=A0A4R9LST2_9LEPT|nr:NAD(P)H-dependent oxidoreductase [Leptospira ilyithenensis]TGN14547.1 NADPH-dependent oxidoreductase [Leptospira ilyithenensis]